MTEKEYLLERIKELQRNVKDSSLPMKQRLNQAKALKTYKYELDKLNNIID